MAELREEDIASFRNFVRMDPQMLQELCARLGPRFEGTDTWMTKALSPKLKLAITLRHLATGDSYRSLMYGFRMAHNTISLIVRQVCRAIAEEYAPEVISTPTMPEWLQIADQFGARWQFHHALGGIWTFLHFASSPPGRFAPWTFRPLDHSPPGRFAPGTIRHLDRSPPHNGRFAPYDIDVYQLTRDA